MSRIRNQSVILIVALLLTLVMADTTEVTAQSAFILDSSENKCSDQCVTECQTSETPSCLSQCNCDDQPRPSNEDLFTQNQCYASCSNECASIGTLQERLQCIKECPCKCNKVCLNHCDNIGLKATCSHTCGCHKQQEVETEHEQEHETETEHHEEEHEDEHHEEHEDEHHEEHEDEHDDDEHEHEDDHDDEEDEHEKEEHHDSDHHQESSSNLQESEQASQETEQVSQEVNQASQEAEQASQEASIAAEEALKASQDALKASQDALKASHEAQKASVKAEEASQEAEQATQELQQSSPESLENQQEVEQMQQEVAQSAQSLIQASLEGTPKKTLEQIENEIITELLEKAKSDDLPKKPTLASAIAVDTSFNDLVQGILDDSEKCTRTCWRPCMKHSINSQVLNCAKNCGCAEDSYQLLEIRSHIAQLPEKAHPGSVKILFVMMVFLVAASAVLCYLHDQGKIMKQPKQKFEDEEEIIEGGYEKLD